MTLTKRARVYSGISYSIDMNDPSLGRILANRYQLEELVGKGAMGRVYRAKDVLLGDVPVAVKFLSSTLLTEKMRERFRSEARTCALLGQKTIHVVRVMDYGVDDDDIPFYVMEYLRGEGLSELIRMRQLPLPRFLSLTRQTCQGLQYAHQDGIVHRDIKPGNILITQETTLGELAKILDFGIARLLQDDSEQTHSFMGTLAYSSPEQMEGKELDNRSDIYSLGVMMFEMLTGKLPLQVETHTFASWYKAHHTQTPRSLEVANPILRVPKALETLVMGCLEKSPNNRPQSVAEILKSLEPLEDRFGPGRQMGQRLEAVLSKLPVPVPAPVTPENLSIDDICRLSVWPNDKPIAEIVFPQVISTGRSSQLATLWVMLSQQDIEQRLSCTRYNQFLCLMAPYPMVLWITALYTPELGPRWLPCYLDLKTPQGQEMARLLAERGHYRILFFAKEGSKQCMHVLASTLDPMQGKQLLEWANTSQITSLVGQATVSKNYLKQELEKLKPKIVLKLESMTSNSL